MVAQHSISYNNLPDWFVDYDIWSVEDEKYLSPDIFESLISNTDISYIKPQLTTFNNMSDIILKSEMQSVYRDGVVEGIVIKTNEGVFCKDVFKVVNRFFNRRNNFNDELIKNKLGNKPTLL